TPDAEALAEKDFDQDVIDGLADAQITQSFGVDIVDDVPVATVNELTTGEPTILTGRIDTETYDDPETGFTVSGRQIDGNGQLTVLSGENISVGNSTAGPGFGVKATPESGVEGQLGYDPTEAISEEVVIDFDYDVTGFSFTVANLYNNEFNQGEGVEEGHWAAYKDGNLVAEGDFTANIGTNQGSYDIELPEGVTIDQLVFTANEYAQGIPDGEDGQTTTVDSSDYWITGIDFSYVDPQGGGTGGEEVTGQTVVLDEDDLSDGSDTDKEGLSAEGDLNLAGEDLISIDYGADGPADGAPTALQYGDLDFSFDISSLPTDLTSNGDAITFTQVDGVLTATADAGGANERPVFTVTLNPDATYTFELQDQLDHAVATAEDVLSIGFTIQGVPKDGVEGTDYDLDPAVLDGLVFNHDFAVQIVDDVPVAVDDNAGSIDEGQSVSGSVMTNDTEGADGATVTEVSYTDANGQPATAVVDPVNGATVTT
ncbi:hypothetical protein HH303_19895, partial [Rhodospirillaceae bacterium KN72]